MTGHELTKPHNFLAMSVSTGDNFIDFRQYDKYEHEGVSDLDTSRRPSTCHFSFPILWEQ